MQISQETLAVLKNFAQINTNILVREGSELRTISTMKDIFVTAQVKEEFPQEFAIYDLTSLLALLSLSENQEVEFGEKSLKIVKDAGEFEYFYADPSIIIAPPNKNIVVDEYFKFAVTKEELVTVQKAAAIVSAPMISFIDKKGKVTLSVGDPKTPASNSYKKIVGEHEGDDFDIKLAVGNLKVIADAYEVVLSKKKFIHFRNEERGLKYWLAADPASVV